MIHSQREDEDADQPCSTAAVRKDNVLLTDVFDVRASRLEQVDFTWVCSQNYSRPDALEHANDADHKYGTDPADAPSLNALLEYADEDILSAFKISAETWFRKQTRLGTKINYYQQKCDLIAQNLEGYSRTFCAVFNSIHSTHSTSEDFDEARCTIGTFKLEAHRFIDLLLSRNCSHGLDSELLLAEKHVTSFKHLVELIGFRFARCSNTPISRTVSQLVYASLLRVIVTGHFDLNSLYPYLNPSDSCCHAQMRQSEFLKDMSTSHLLEQKMALLNNMKDYVEQLQLRSSLERLMKIGFDVCRHSCMRALSISALKMNLDKEHKRERIHFMLQHVFILGPYICHDTVTTTRILSYFNLATIAGQLKPETMETVLATCVLPGLCLIKPNPMLYNSLWKVLSGMSFVKRTKIYKHASEIVSKPNAHLANAQQAAARSVQRMLRRLSKQNVKELGRKLGKISARFPFTTISIVLQQIQVYPNMIDSIVDACKYWSSTTFDILVYKIILRFSEGATKLKDDGQHVSLWFSALSAFCGSLYKKYQNIELSALLAYILNTLQDGQSLDLIILKDLVTKLTGTEILKDMSFAQIMSPAFGKALNDKHQLMDEKERVKGRVRLRRALETNNDSTNITTPLLLVLVNRRQKMVFEMESSQLKFISQLYDECHAVFLQYVLFLQQAYSASEYDELFPDVRELLCDYKFEPAVVFHIYRPILKRIEHSRLVSGSSDAQRWHDITCDVEKSLPARLWRIISPEFYMIFWTLSIDDIYVPIEIYETEIKKTQQQLNLVNSSAHFGGMTPKIEELKNRMKELSAELSSLHTTVETNLSRFAASRHKWMNGGTVSLTACDIVQSCIFPRIRISRTDAIYAGKFIKFMHDVETPRFSVLQYHDRLFSDVAHVMYLSSETESKCLGTFMLDTLQQLSRWKCSEIYEKECWCLGEFNSSLNSASCQANFADFIKISYKWEHRLVKGILNKLRSNDYMKIYNTLNLLILVVSEIPKSHHLGVHVYKQVKRIQAGETRGDIRTVAVRYLSLLNAESQRWNRTELKNTIRAGNS